MRQLPSRYQPLGPAFGGGMSEVIVCRDSDLERLVAIKFIRDPEDRRRLFDEVKALQRIRSKHVVQVYDIFISEQESDIGIVEEYVSGEDLNGGSLLVVSDAKRYIRLLYQVARGIEDIHAANVIHRDIKPDNIKIDSVGIVKIFDFGLAREEGIDDATQGFVATPSYAAPELWREGKVGFTKSVDIFAFGLLAWNLTQSGIPASLRKIPPSASTPLPTFSDAKPDLPESVSTILDRTLLPDPGERPNAADLRDCLEKHLLLGSHRALLVHKGTPYFLGKDRSQVTLRNPPHADSIVIIYTGLRFVISSITGHVYINNLPAATGAALPSSCVIGLGHPSQRGRLFPTFDISNPEVVL